MRGAKLSKLTGPELIEWANRTLSPEYTYYMLKKVRLSSLSQVRRAATVRARELGEFTYHGPEGFWCTPFGGEAWGGYWTTVITCINCGREFIYEGPHSWVTNRKCLDCHKAGKTSSTTCALQLFATAAALTDVLNKA